MGTSTDRIKQEEIPGFRVMEWLEKIREEDYKLRKEDPERYAREKQHARERIRKQFSERKKAVRST